MKTRFILISYLLLFLTGYAAAAINPLNVTAPPYNAVGDGVADDTSAIQKALSDATASGGGTVFIPDGIYKITAMLSVGSNTRVEGGGRGTTIIRSPSGQYPGITANGTFLSGTFCLVGVTDSSIENLTVDGKTNGNANNAIQIIPSGAGAPCMRCTVQNCELLGANLSQSLFWGMIWEIQGQGIKVLNNYIDGGVVSNSPTSTQIGIFIYGGSDVLIQGNTCANIGAYGMFLFSVGGYPVSGLKVIENHVNVSQIGINCGTQTGAIGLNDMAHTQLKNNTVIGAWNYGINVTQAPSSSFRDVQISGNSIENAPYGISLTGDPTSVREDISVSLNSITNVAPSGYGILIYNMANLSVTGNMIRRTTISVWCYYSSNLLFANNLSDTASQYGLCLGTCQGLTIRSNRFNNYNNSGGGYFGIRGLNLTNSVIMQNEFLTANDTTAVNVYGSANQVRLSANTILYSTTAIPFINSGTNPNQGQIQPLSGTNRTVVSNTLVNANSRFVVTQTAGSPMTFRADPVAGGFELVTSGNAAGNETFNYEIQ